MGTRGFAGRSFQSEIFRIPDSGDNLFEAEWVVANPKNSESVATLQYDGNDGSFGEPNRAGLNGFDITWGGNGEFLTFFVVTDLPTQYTVQFYDSTSGVCEVQVSVSPTPDGYTYADTQIDIPLSSFTGCNKNSIGAIQFLLHLVMLLMLLLDVFPFLVLLHLNLTPQLVLLLQPQQEHLLKLQVKLLPEHLLLPQVDLSSVPSYVIALPSLVSCCLMTTTISCFTINRNKATAY